MTSFTVKDIAKLMKDSKKSRKPFVFFTGAGCSKSADIPLALELVAEINKKHKTALKELTVEQKKDYGACMGALGKAERRALIQAHIKKSKINWAHIALACMLEAGYISRVLTFNFDNLLARASSLIGLYPATYDFTSANPDLHHLIVEPALVHLHGQGEGFIQLNTEKETYDHAEKLSNFIAATLNSSPSLFIGYSGGADAFFPLLKKKFKGEYRLVWTSYSDRPSKLVGDFLEANKRLTHFVGEQDADLFLINLANELGCFPPKLFENPYEHLLKVFDNVQPFPTKMEHSRINLLSEVKKHLKIASRNSHDIKTFKLESLFINHKYDELITYFKGLDDHVSDFDKEIACWAYIQKANNLIDIASKTKDESLYSNAYDFYLYAQSVRGDIYELYYNWGGALFAQAEINSDLAVYYRAMDKFKKSLSFNSKDYEILNNLGSCLLNIGVLEDARDKIIESIEVFERASSFKDNNISNFNLGTAWHELALIDQNSNFLLRSYDFFKKAYEIDNGFYHAFYGMATVLFDMGKIFNSMNALVSAKDLYIVFLDMMPDHYNALHGLASCLLKIAYLSPSNDQCDSLEQAEKYFNLAVLINKNDIFVFACFDAFTGNLSSCQEKMLHCEKFKTLPTPLTKYKLSINPYLDSIRHLDWFKELLARLPD